MNRLLDIGTVYKNLLKTRNTGTHQNLNFSSPKIFTIFI